MVFVMDNKSIIGTLTCFALMFFGSIHEVHGIRCYQCASTNNTHPFQCNEFLTSDIDIEPESCDAIFGARYCVKHIGRFEVITLDCYQCTSAEDWKCMDGDLLMSSVRPVNCSHVYDAQYCIKSVGRYGDGIGTKRFCSPVDRGNYCDYVQQPGDKLTYRTCIYTCTGDGCNSAPSTSGSIIPWLLSISVLIARPLL